MNLKQTKLRRFTKQQYDSKFGTSNMLYKTTDNTITMEHK